MKFAYFICLFVLTIPSLAQEQQILSRDYPRWTKAQKYAAEGFQPLDCFAGQVRVRGKRVARQPFSVFLPDAAMKCCGSLVSTGRTDEHGHFLIEPMKEGTYFAQFYYRAAKYVTNFAVIESYERCDGAHVEVNFLDTTNAVTKTFVDINDSGEPCSEQEPSCYRR